MVHTEGGRLGPASETAANTFFQKEQFSRTYKKKKKKKKETKKKRKTQNVEFKQHIRFAFLLARATFVWT